MSGNVSVTCPTCDGPVNLRTNECRCTRLAAQAAPDALGEGADVEPSAGRGRAATGTPTHAGEPPAPAHQTKE